METIKKGSKSVTLYDDPECLPADNYYRFNKYLLLEGSIGSSLNDFAEKHLNALFVLIENEKKQEAITQVNNLRQLFHMTANEINVSQLAFACLVHSINGVRIEDYSESGLKWIVNEIGKIGITQKELKKKHLKYQLTL